MNIQILSNNFNPNYWHVKEFFDSKSRYCFCWGGSGSGKTRSIVQAIVLDTFMNGNSHLVVRKVSNKLDITILPDFRAVMKEFGLSKYFKFKGKPLSFTCIHNGAVIDLIGLNDSEDIKGISQYRRVYMNEITSFDHADYKQMRKRLRGSDGLQLISDFNPIDETHWLKKSVFDAIPMCHSSLIVENGLAPELTTVSDKYVSSDGSFVFIKTNAMNNFWIAGSPDGSFGFRDVEYLKDFERDKETDPNYWNIYFNGNWGKVSRGTEFYKLFSAVNNISGDISYDEDMPLHLSFDENVKPYITCTVSQIDGGHVMVIDEFCLRNPRNDIFSLCKAITSKYSGHKGKVFVYGDATSKKRNTLLEQGRNWFDVIASELSSTFDNITMRVPSSNPNVSQRGVFMNKVMIGDIPGLSLSISRDYCPNTIEDLMYVQEDPSGGKLKQKYRDPDTKETYERYGHTSDTLDYLVCSAFRSEFDNWKNSGSMIEPMTVIADRTYDEFSI